MFLLRKLSTYTLDFIFPKDCISCGKRGSYLCSKCRIKIPNPDIDENSNEILGAVSYQSPLIKKTIRALKYRGVRQMAKPLAGLIYERLLEDLSEVEPDIIVPIPLSQQGLRKRGFNQAELIAKHLSDMLSTSDVGQKNIGCYTNVLYKNKSTISQVEIKDRKKRLKNLNGAFSVKNSELIKNKVILVVDDVSTTGATILEARRALLARGAKEVYGVVVAK